MKDETDLNGITAAAGSVAGGLFYNNIIQIINAKGIPLTEAEAREYEQQYLRRVMHDCGSLDWLATVRYQDDDSPGVNLESVYTALLTTTPGSMRSERGRRITEQEPSSESPLSAVEAINANDRLVLLGEPGSGKSAFVNFVSLCMAGEALGATDANLAALTEPLPDERDDSSDKRQPWDHGVLLPVRVILRDFATSSHFPAVGQVGEAEHLAAFLQHDLQAKRCGDYFPLLEARLRTGEALLLFDGLDEVSQAGERRERMLQCITAFAGSFDKTRYLVTCRPYAYEQADWQLGRFRHAMLADFGRGQIERFIERWYANRAEYDAETARERAQKLKQAVLGREALRELAKRPLLLTLTAYLHAHRFELPERRADLYERLLELLIEKWEQARFKADDSAVARNRDQFSLATFLQVGMDSIRLVLERLAFEAHAEQTDLTGTADIPAQKLTHNLYCLTDSGREDRGDDPNIRELSEYLRDRVGILYQRGAESELDAIYTFPHRSFQEYLAASYFRREEKRLFDRFAASIACDEWPELAAHLGTTDPDRWREVVVLAGGIKAVKEPGPAWDLIDNLVPESIDNPAFSPSQGWGLRLAGEILVDNLKREQLTPKKQKMLERVRLSLPFLLTAEGFDASERVASGRYLAALGDPRAEVSDVDQMRFCLVPQGAFFLGSTDTDQYALSSEKEGAGEHRIDYAYWLARFPVTVAQFRQFVTETGYQPESEHSLDGLGNAPVVYVSWHVANAFCRWLNDRWQAKGWLPADYCVTLPSEPEWEKAARGGERVPTPGNQCVGAIDEIGHLGQIGSINAVGQFVDNPMQQRRYPWDDKPDVDNANFEFAIGGVSTVGAYPGGASPYGCEELIGNVWEWTRSDFAPYPYPEDAEGRRAREGEGADSRVLRGGAFDLAQGLARCACRFYSDPDDRLDHVGFRVVLSPLR